jgi:hypothetical protein
MKKDVFVEKAKATLDRFLHDEWSSFDDDLSPEHWRALMVAWGHGFATTATDRNRTQEVRKLAKERATTLELVGLGINGPIVPGMDAD